MKLGMLKLTLGMAMIACFVNVQISAAAEMMFACPKCSCPDGCRYEEVITHSCKSETKMVPIKKTVYETKEIPYCRHNGPHHRCCEECESCARYKRVLIKKEITCGEKCETKCVPVEHKEMVLVPCHRCGHAPQGCGPQGGPCAQTENGEKPQYVQASSRNTNAPVPPPVEPFAKKNNLSGKSSPTVVVAEPFSIR